MNKEVIVIPTYNEKENIVSHLSILTGLYPDMDILVVDDSSPDGTGDLVRGFASSHPQVSILVRKKKSGLGEAYKDALARLSEREDVSRIYTMDADGSHDPKYIASMRSALNSGADLVIGSRYVSGGGVANWDWKRKFLSRFGNIYSGFLLGLAIKDLTAGFVGFSREALRKIDVATIASDGYAYQIEFKHRLIRSGAKAVEIPIVFCERLAGRSKMHPVIILEGLFIPLRIGIFRRIKNALFRSRRS